MEFQINNDSIERKPECDHVYSEVFLEEDIPHCCAVLTFRCEWCGELHRIKISQNLTRRFSGY